MRLKTHFATVERANESDNSDYWSETVCGLETENTSDDWGDVDCKKCLKLKEQFAKEMKIAMEHNCNDMAEFVKFMNFTHFSNPQIIN